MSKLLPLFSIVTLAAVVTAGCGKETNTAAPASRDLQTTPQYGTPAPTPTGGALPGTTDTRVMELLALTRKLRETSSAADATMMFRYVKKDGTKEWLRSRYRYQKPRRNNVSLITGSDSKVEGSQLIWTGGEKVKVKTKFVGFWLNIELPLSDDRLKDPVGYRLDETAIDKLFDALLHPQAQVTYLTDGNLIGRPMAVLSVVSPARLKPATREVYGIEKATGVPMLREMYKGDQVYWRMQMESNKPNVKLTSADFELQ